jgi:ABC-type sugar transport system substrate-binding protein
MKGVFRGRGRLAFLAVLALTATASVVALAASAPAATKLKIVWLEQGAGNPYWEAQHRAAAEAGRRLGFSFKAVSGNLNPSDQANIMRQQVDQKPDLIMLNAIDPKAMAPSLAYAKSKGVKVLNLYGIDKRATASVTFSEIRTGRVAAKVTIGLLKQRYGKAAGKVAVLTGILGQPASDLRAKGFTDYMKTQPGVKVVAVQPTGWQADKASAAMQSWLVKYPDLAFVYALSDTLAVPAANIAQRQRRLCTQQSNWTSNSRCTGFVAADGIFADEVKKGRLYATQLYSPEWSGYLFAKIAHDVASGKTYKRTNIINAYLITPANATCSLRMINDMKNKLRTFPFGPSLQAIAKKPYGCKVLDANM